VLRRPIKLLEANIRGLQDGGFRWAGVGSIAAEAYLHYLTFRLKYYDHDVKQLVELGNGLSRNLGAINLRKHEGAADTIRRRVLSVGTDLGKLAGRLIRPGISLAESQKAMLLDQCAMDILTVWQNKSPDLEVEMLISRIRGYMKKTRSWGKRLVRSEAISARD
jgi:hypothetical protein